MKITHSSINNLELPDIEAGEHDLVILAKRGAGGIEVFAPEKADLDIGQQALLAASLMIARDIEFVRMFIDWGEANNIYDRSMAGEFDDR